MVIVHLDNSFTMGSGLSASVMVKVFVTVPVTMTFAVPALTLS